MSAQQMSEVDLLLTGSACPSSSDHLATKFSCRLLFGPTVVPYFACNEGFIYWLLSYACVFFFPAISPVCCLFAIVSGIGFSQYFSPFCCFLDIFPCDVWDFETLIRTLC